ncbi:glutamine amidotransferase family protein [Kaistia dalseonensis]|uniref:Glutamate synthase domain-containing protein 1 n=1 Tax=Kaistia dalseonensis TaxID=410840 RepID=A0ABU0H6C7_9HYPH|nr:glutamine amidotransferase family protein [Kaistia dalseonensis]MCX5495273.1 glutamine amidotransferase family protein [Kaistia dalseonensis]MDQ0437859.1 glutamate synthase domain-containing protein 1 [Kaistia dalseonensis]
MCGIVGLFLKDASLEPELGAMLAGMLGVMCDRGPDSAGFAVYGAGETGQLKLTLRGPAGTVFSGLQSALDEAAGARVAIVARDTHAVITIPATREFAIRTALAQIAPDITVVGVGARMELYKEVGLPSDVAIRFGLDRMAGTHGIGHTRMATESAVTTDGAHPFSTGTDQCLVHNGSLSNHASLRRDLVREGLSFSTDNDSEVAAAYLTSRMREGDSLGEALEHSLKDLDGFYTFVVGTETGFGVLRDPIACKPAVMAETDRYVAFGSEYRALAGLPDIEHARIWEPEPARVYFWDRAA